VGEFFLVVGVLVLTAFVFVVWLCMRVAGLIIHAIFGTKRTNSTTNSTLNTATCSNPRCRAPNAHHARFCSRCGSPAGAGRMRYVA
jgi:hypothetical protein